MPTVLLVDDEAPHLQILEKIFRREKMEVLSASNGRMALEVLRREPVQLIITDLMMPEMDGLDLLKATQTLYPEIEVILMTAFGTVEKAVEAMRLGACDFVTKPIKRAVLLKSARQALERQALRAENRSLKAQLAGFQSERKIVGSSAALREVTDLVKQVAPSRTSVLLTGESGTGKELIARAIHDHSDRSDKPFVAVNCAAIPESILEAELFGTEKGAYTDSRSRAGRFEMANGSTLFLDEIGELPLPVQSKFLRVLQEEEVERLGSSKKVKLNVRIIAATNKNLEEEVKAGRFRTDLYYRLNVILIDLPPLRARTEDIPLLAAHFLRRYAARNQREISGLTRGAEEALLNWTWPGNVRELENAMERASVLDKDGVIDVDDLPASLAAAKPEQRSLTIPLGTPLGEIERQVIHETLRMTGGDKKLAAKLLGIATRTIYRKI